MKVVRYPVCTNFRMSDPSMEGNYSGQCARFDVIDTILRESTENTVDDSMILLEDVKQEYPELNMFTEWSVVYNLTDFSADYVVNMDYDEVYHLNPKEF